MQQTTKGEIPIILSSSDEYSIYIPVILNSLKKNSSEEYFYRVYVLDSGIEKESKFILNEYAGTLGNYSIQFIDVNDYIDKYKDLWYIVAHFSPATYVRFFLAELFPELHKVLYLDIDLLVLGDVAELYHTDIKDYAVGAAVDACYERQTYYNEDGVFDYNVDIMRYPVDYKVFNAGVLLVNLAKWRELNIAEKAIKRLSEIGRPRVLDQCVLNSIFCDRLVYALPEEWNYQWHANLTYIELPTSSKKFDDVIKSYRRLGAPHIKIIHYTTQTKPWNTYVDSPFEKQSRGYTVEEELVPLWWKYARNTPFYEKIIMQNVVRLLGKSISSINHPAIDSLINDKKYLLGVFRVKKNGDTTQYYFLGIRVGKKVKNSLYKKIYLFNVQVYKKQRNQTP